MIYLEKNTTNSVVLTLTENSRINNPYFLFIFENEYDLDENNINFTTNDTSPYPNRYNQFNIVESSSGSITGGTSVPLNLTIGQYKYTIYESSASTLSYSATTQRVVETGRMVVASDYNETTLTGATTSVYI